MLNHAWGSGTRAPANIRYRSGRMRPTVPRRGGLSASAAAGAATRRRSGYWMDPRRKSRCECTCGDAPGCEAGGQIAHEGGRSTDVEIAIARHAQLLEHSHVQASGSVEIHAWPILGIGRALANVAVAMRQSFEDGARLSGKSMLAAVVGARATDLQFPPRRDT